LTPLMLWIIVSFQYINLCPTLTHRLTVAMNVNKASNSADNNDAADGNDMPNTTNAMDADVFEIITQIQTSGILDSDSTVPNPEHILLAKSESLPNLDLTATVSNPEQILSAELEPPPENLPDMCPEVVEYFPYGKAGAPIDDMQGVSIYTSSQDTLGRSVYEPFQSECNWAFAHWAKMNGPSALSLTKLLAIPEVGLFFFFFAVLLKVV